MRKVRCGERKRNVRHQTPSGTVGRRLAHFHQTLADRRRMIDVAGPTGLGRRSRRQRQHRHPGPRSAHREVVDLAITAEPRDVGERHRLDPADPLADRRCLGQKPVDAPLRRASEDRIVSALGKFAESEGVAAPSCRERHRRPSLGIHDVDQSTTRFDSPTGVGGVARRLRQFEQEYDDPSGAVVERVIDG